MENLHSHHINTLNGNFHGKLKLLQCNAALGIAGAINNCSNKNSLRTRFGTSTTKTVI